MNCPDQLISVMSRNSLKGKLLRKLAAKQAKNGDIDEKLNKWSAATAYTPKDILDMFEIVENQDLVHENNGRD